MDLCTIFAISVNYDYFKIDKFVKYFLKKSHLFTEDILILIYIYYVVFQNGILFLVFSIILKFDLSRRNLG